MNEDIEEIEKSPRFVSRSLKDEYFGIDFSILDEFPDNPEPGSLLDRCRDLLVDCMMAFDDLEDEIEEEDDDDYDDDDDEEGDILFDDETSALIQRMIVTLQTLKPDLTPEEIVVFAVGMRTHNRTLSLCRYIDLGMVQQGWCDIDVVMSGQMCEVYAACSSCTGRDGKPLKPRSIQTALMRYFKKQQA